MNTSEMFEGENSSLRKTFESVITPDTEMVEDAFKCFHKSNMGWHILTPEMMGKQPTIDDFINTAKQTTLKLLTSRDKYWKERVRKDVKDAYEHAEIVRQRTLNEIRQAVEDDESYGGAKECVYKILDRY